MKSLDDVVYVDSREPQNRKIRAENKWNAQVEQLAVGDYVYKSTGIEYKTIEDFLSSITDGRLRAESVAQMYTFDHHYVMIVGDVDKTIAKLWFKAKVRVSRKMFDAALVSLTTYTNVMMAPTEDKAFDLMDLIFQKNNDGKDRTTIPLKKPTQNPVYNYLASIYKIGNEKARLITTELDLKTLNELMVIQKDDLLAIRGIGEDTANRVMGAII